MIKASSALIILSLFLTLACGKEQKEASDAQNDHGHILPIEIEKQTLFCEPGVSCPSFLAKILVRDEGKQRFCSGTLVAPNIVMTSASCLPRSLRSSNVNCSDDLYFFFYKSDNNGIPQKAGCKKIIQVSTLAGDNSLVWRDDVAFVEIDKNLYHRRQLAISREGVSNDKEYEQVSIEQVDQYKAVIRRKECSVVFNSYINPLAQNESSPGIVVSGCQFQNGTAGAPLLDSKGRIRGVLSQDMNQQFRNYLLAESGWLLGQPLKSISHATNFACAPSLYDTYQVDEEECSKTLSQVDIDNQRKAQLDSTNLFSSNLREAKRDISANDFLEFGVRLIPLEKEKQFITEIYPVCFKNVNSWIKRVRSNENYRFSLKSLKLTLKRMMNQDGKMLPLQTASDKMEATIHFSPKNLSAVGKSYVVLEDIKGRVEYTDLIACQ